MSIADLKKSYEDAVKVQNIPLMMGIMEGLLEKISDRADRIEHLKIYKSLLERIW